MDDLPESAVDESSVSASSSSSTSLYDSTDRTWRASYAQYTQRWRGRCNDGACTNVPFCNGMCRTCYDRSRVSRCATPHCRRRATVVKDMDGLVVTRKHCMRCACVRVEGAATNMMLPPKRRKYCRTPQCRRSAHKDTPYCRLCNEAREAGAYEAHAKAIRMDLARRKAAYRKPSTS